MKKLLILLLVFGFVKASAQSYDVSSIASYSGSADTIYTKSTDDSLCRRSWPTGQYIGFAIQKQVRWWRISKISGLQAALDAKAGTSDLTSYVPATITVNGHALSGNVTVTAADLSLGNVTNESKATMFTNPTFTGTFTADAGSIGNAALANGAVANLSGTNTGDNAVNSNYSGLVSNATHTGDATGATALTVVALNGTNLAGLGTGILKNTTGTGVPSIAVAGDFPTLNQSTTGSAATLTTTRSIYGNNFNGSAALSQVIASTFGGTGNGFTKFSGATTTERTYTLPDASATILTDNAVVTAAQGGTGINNSTRTLTISTNAGTIAFGAASKTLTINNSIGLTGTDATTMTFPSTSATIARTDAAQTFTGKQTFSPTGTTPGLNWGSNAGDPSGPANGDTWYNSTTGKFRGRQNGANVDIVITGAGTGDFILANNNTVGGINTFTNYQILQGGSGGNGMALYFDPGSAVATATNSGAMGVDANAILYYNHATNEKGVVHAEQFISLTSTYTLASQTAAQKLFNSSTNGAVTVASSKSYFFECFYTLSSMSSTSGSFGFAFGGTATFTSQAWHTSALKATTLTTAATMQTTFNTAANTTIVTASTATGGICRVWGIVRINAGGTLIPSVSLGVAAAAVVGVNSYFRLVPIGTNTVTNVGNWN